MGYLLIIASNALARQYGAESAATPSECANDRIKVRARPRRQNKLPTSAIHERHVRKRYRHLNKHPHSGGQRCSEQQLSARAIAINQSYSQL